ncbi:hypothetical protein BS50DRAFT_504653 [Corynespora cassiicola Philippines]|uniref:E3 ubiquitin-protein ligase listerin n=1 Tax=Corynespora cassiicola Philippines TaxID=1448308 RepID=A0A2T2N7E3_CORCC|nr:hypothetical protein BS50DRAFT_504653 [Corynespora cassiicola Philippines]
MSKRQAKSQASSARAASSALGAPFGAPPSAFGTASSQLSYVAEPPDLSSISDANVGVCFKNLSKKDSTTKAKALEDLHAYVSSLQEPVEEGVLEAWIKIYPRTSIDNAKSVRQSAHALHGLVAAAAGKRIARHMPKAVGAWLCGLYDGDRSVVEATQNSLRLVFTTPDKIQSIRRVYQLPILEYCRDAIDKESALTLSDERTVSPDDAAAKYSRVISACLSLAGSLIANLQPGELSKFQSHYDGLLADGKLWAFASHSDASIRRSLHRFLKTCCSKQPDAVRPNLEAISKSYLSVALNSDQTNSAYDYLDALALLSSTHPSVWTEHYTSKTAVERRLRQFLKRGSQAATRQFWHRLVDLFRALPPDALPRGGPDAAELLSALHGGIIRKDESRLSLESAWIAYLEITAVVCYRLAEEEQRRVLDELVLPIISQYLRPSPEYVDWAIPNHSTTIVTKAATVSVVMCSVLRERWALYAHDLVGAIKTSAPEQSKDHAASQNALAQQATRLAHLQNFVVQEDTFAPLLSMFTETCSSIIDEAIKVVEARNGKPYGAAATIWEFLHHHNCRTLLDSNTIQGLETFVLNAVPHLILSPSSLYIVDILYAFIESAIFEDSWRTALEAILQEDDSTTKEKALGALLKSSKLPTSFDLALTNVALQKYIILTAQKANQGLLEWETFNLFLQSPIQVVASSTADEVLTSLALSLSVSQQAPFALQGLRQIMKQNPSMLKTFLSKPQGANLLQTLLLASESSDEDISQSATAVNTSIQTMLSAASDTKQIFELIHRGLREATQTSVSVETLIDLARQLVRPTDGWEGMRDVLPLVEDWDAALSPFLQLTPNPSLAITNCLGGAVYLLDFNQTSHQINVSRDLDGYSAAYRIAQYVARLFKSGDLLRIEEVPSNVCATLVRNISLTVQLVSDNLGLAGANQLWAAHGPDVEADAMGFLADARSLIRQNLKQLSNVWTGSGGDTSLLSWALELLSTIDADVSVTAYYMARAYGSLVADAIDVHGWKSSENVEIQGTLGVFRKNKNDLALIAFLHAFKEPLAAARACERMCNEILANLTGLDIELKHIDCLQQLVILNNLLYGQEKLAESIAKQRLIFFIKHVIPWLQQPTISLSVRAELCRALTVLLPLMSDIYGEHWQEILHVLVTTWLSAGDIDEYKPGRDSSIPFTHASLKLCSQLRVLAHAEESNDDLQDAWKEMEGNIGHGLVVLLKHSQHFPDDFHQPLKMLNDVLARQISNIPHQLSESNEELYQLLYVESRPVQQAAFDILHKQIPAAQEQISIDTVLEKTTARLPDELLSLILEAPTMTTLSGTEFERGVPLSLRGYLLSWLLVFDHLEHSSFKVRNDYIDHLKQGDYLPDLLNFAFAFLGHTSNRPVDISKLDITTYTAEIEPPKRDAQWLLTHLYYLCLRHIPSLVKNWYIDCKSRPIAVTLEPWTQKYISPPVISAAIQSVAEWATSQAETEPDSPFMVKVSPRAGEITASYIVDEQTMAMRIQLPPAFPLANAHIEGINRVAVNEQKWQSWLRTSLGAITIFNGNLIDALTTFKRNVDGAMKGQTECAICYSIVGSDRKLPDKRCQTCKNLFHGSCLFKWFKTSGSSSCPLCRNNFNYG